MDECVVLGCVLVCVCVGWAVFGVVWDGLEASGVGSGGARAESSGIVEKPNTHDACIQRAMWYTHTHTHILYIYIYMLSILTR